MTSSQMRCADTVLFHFQPSSFFGWGVYGINMMLYWPGTALSTLPPGQIAVPDPTMAGVLQARLEACRTLQEKLAQDTGMASDYSLIAIFGNGGLDHGPHGGELLAAASTVPLACFERADFAGGLREVDSYPVVLTTSDWCRDQFRAAGVAHARTVYQGVDTDLFSPRPREDDGVFRIFSGGKLEHRKGQDIVLAAFRIFCRRRPSARLQVAWHSPWQDLARSMQVKAGVPAVPFTAQGQIDVSGWIAANGIDPSLVTPLDLVPNAYLPEQLGSCDVAVFPSRCEGAINNMAMEAIACGVPTVVSHNTGHKELAALTGCEALRSQGRIAGDAHVGWGESSVDELVEVLDRIYLDREAARRRAAAARNAITALHWPKALAALKSAIEAAAY